MSSAIGNFGKKIKVLIFTSPRNCIVYLGPHSEGTGEGGGERDTQIWSYDFIGIGDWTTSLQTHFLMVNLNRESRN